MPGAARGVAERAAALGRIVNYDEELAAVAFLAASALRHHDGMLPQEAQIAKWLSLPHKP
jgi:hypothetical protein